VITVVEGMLPEFGKLFEEEKEFYFKKFEQILGDNDVMIFIKGSGAAPM
jgi:hypothetical protein